MNIAENLQQVLSELPDGVRLVAISKFHPNEAIEEAYRTGQRIFGESKVQEMTAKYESLPKDIEWHFIGHLQTNKIKFTAWTWLSERCRTRSNRRSTGRRMSTPNQKIHNLSHLAPPIYHTEMGRIRRRVY